MLINKNVFSVLRIMMLFFVCGVEDFYCAPPKGLSLMKEGKLMEASKRDVLRYKRSLNRISRPLIYKYPSLFGEENVTTNFIEIKPFHIPASSFFSQMLRKNKRGNIVLSASHGQQDSKVSSVSDTLIKSSTMMNGAFFSIYMALLPATMLFLCRSLSAVSNL